MSYDILECHCVFENDKLKEVAVLWSDNGSVRATYSNLNPKSGYETLTSKSSITPQLLQRVAGGGSYVDEERRKKYFSGNRNWSR
jgi:hypothetical protein